MSFETDIVEVETTPGTTIDSHTRIEVAVETEGLPVTAISVGIQVGGLVAAAMTLSPGVGME